MALNQDNPQPSSPLTELPTSDAESCSFPSPKQNNTDEDSESPEDMAEPNIRSSSPYLPNDETPQVTATSTPLKNKPFGSRQMSAAASRNLQRLASDPYKCILTRQVPQMGCTITKSHIIPQATPPPEVRDYEWLLGYDAGTFSLDSHFNVTYLVGDWHTNFDAGRWMMVPEQATREEILLNLTRIKNEMTEVSSGVKIENEMKEVSSGVKSQWPIFHKVYSKDDGVYNYRFINISIQMLLCIYEPPENPALVDVNGDHPLLTLRSHIHPLHVIINAYKKIQGWLPAPQDAPTLEVINDIRAIYEVWDSVPMTDQFRTHHKQDNNDYAGLGPPPKTRSHSRRSGSSLGKRTERDEDNADGRGRGRRRTDAAADGTADNTAGDHIDISGAEEEDENSNIGPAMDDIPSLDKSCSSHEVSSDSFDIMALDNVRIWQDSLIDTQLSTEYPKSPSEFSTVGPYEDKKILWKPSWDRRWLDTSSFSSNDWAYYYNNCNLTEGQEDR